MVPSSYHKQPDIPFDAPEIIGGAAFTDVLLVSCISQLSIDVGHSPRSLMVPSSYQKQPDGPFNAPEIIGGATFTDMLMLQTY